jgi:flagellar assembly protein FliH
MTQTQPAKFTFTNEFASGDRHKELEREIAHLQSQLPAAEARGFEGGKTIGGGELARMLERTLGVLNALEIERTALQKDAIELALLTARTLTGKLIDHEPSLAITELAASCVDNLRKCPHIVFRVHPDNVESVEANLKNLAHERGLEGRLIVLGDPEKAQGDCKIEWAEGGFEHRRAEIEQKIADAVNRYMSDRLNQNFNTMEGKNG